MYLILLLFFFLTENSTQTYATTNNFVNRLSSTGSNFNIILTRFDKFPNRLKLILTFYL